MGDFGNGMFGFWILKMGTTPTPILTHIISLYAKESIRDAENPGSKVTQPDFLPVFEREEQIHIGLGRYRFIASRFVSYFSSLQPWPIQHTAFSCKNHYRSSGHTPKFINCHQLKLQRNFYTFSALKLQKTNCFNISNEVLERTAFFFFFFWGNPSWNSPWGKEKPKDKKHPKMILLVPTGSI